MKPAKDIEARVLQLTGLKAPQRAEMVFENAYRFLERYIGQDDWAESYITQSRVFWQWWRLQWRIRDEVFLARVKGRRYGRHQMCSLYQREHCPMKLAGLPPAALIHKEYSRMMDEVHKEWKQSSEPQING